MAVKVFVTGATGYIAGDAIHHIYEKHPEYEYTLLIRTREKADIVKKALPKVNIVIGDLENSSLLEQQASEADVVLHAADASDHEGAAKAIAAGLVKGHTKENPGFWLHTGGSGILTYKDAEEDRLGEHDDKEYNDWSGVEELTHLPDSAFHRNVDKIVLETAEKHGDVVKTALLCPPTIYGKERGPASDRGRQVYEMTKLMLTSKYIPVVGSGKARWNHIHVADLAELFLLLTKAAAAKRLDEEIWGPKGYYLVENGEHVWTELAEKIAHEAEKAGFVGKLEKQDLSKQAALDQAGFEAVSWGLNSRGKAERARKVLGCEPTRPSIFEDSVNIVKEEHERLSVKV
ncbi:hypothetical protein LTS14_002412 [Recurvomyces mirabilis]|uniref:uncharacterized protein n=1 Tax=Recurvomyces mirabilis TaxID=574656 RepID=UPI002DE063FA|nr:hypothetical protein LTS14_002412 [Recurvomyces mirabilis]